MGYSRYNSEGYFDPTAYEALTNISKERKERKKLCLSVRRMLMMWKPML